MSNRKPQRRARTSRRQNVKPTTISSSSPSTAEPYGGKPYLPTGYDERKEIPICTGVLDYFPLALIEVAKVSRDGNIQHNPGEELHWARGKSMNQIDTMIRHIMERGGVDTDGRRHMAKAIWRGLAELQIEMEQALGLPVSRGSRAPS